VAKVRVYELAKEFGVESKVVMAKLQELGEFVRSASSTIEAPVVRKLTDALQQGNGGGKPAPRKAAPAKPCVRKRQASTRGSPRAWARQDGPWQPHLELLQAAETALRAPACAAPQASQRTCRRYRRAPGKRPSTCGLPAPRSSRTPNGRIRQVLGAWP
jgi:hypothetical protein